MRDCVVLGSGRSGTSLLAGVLHDQGYFLGEDLYVDPSPSNPKGFFEDREVNDINEALLGQAPSQGLRLGQRWLLALSEVPQLESRPTLDERIRRVTSRHPFCFKDPRFCYTLPVWRSSLCDAASLCVFREPTRTANSIVKECSSVQYLSDVEMSFDRALDIWTSMYRCVVEGLVGSGDWLFVHYDQILDGSAFTRLGEMLGIQVTSAFADPALRRSAIAGSAGGEATSIYEELCLRANYSLVDS
jgi:hypothetical protein